MGGVAAVAVDKSFGPTRVLRSVSLSIAPGEFVSLVGPSGCGKTTLMRIIAGLERPSAGRVEIDGRDATSVRAGDRNVAMVFQNYALYPHLTAYQNMAVPLAMRRLSSLERMPGIGRLVPGTGTRRTEIDREIREAAALLGLESLLDRKPAQLSGGQRQRVALGRAIVRHPSVFLMDEPLSNLDAGLRVQTRKEIVDIHRRVGAPTLYVTHDQSEAMTMSDRVAVMMAGEIVQVATPQTIYGDPQDLRVARFIGSPAINTLAASVDSDGVVSVAGRAADVTSPVRGDATLAIRPEHVVIGGDGWPARVSHVEFLGDSVLVHAALGSTGDAVIARVGSGRSPVERGAEITVGFEPGHALLFDRDGRRAPAAVARVESIQRRSPAHA